MTNLAQRVLTAAAAIPVIVLITMIGGVPFFLFVAIASGVALWEFYALTRSRGARPLTVPGIVIGFCINAAFFHAKIRGWVGGILGTWDLGFPSQAQLFMILLIAGVVVLGLMELFRNNGSPLLNVSATIMGLLYVPLFFGTLIGIRELFIPVDFPVIRYFGSGAADPSNALLLHRWGGYTVISVMSMIWICDSAAYHVGMAAGKHKLYPRVSPNKSWEGAVAGFIAALASAVAAKYLVLEYLPLSGAFVIGVIVGVIGQLGDLYESLLKRDAGVKDSSALIPGHGGALDRFDSLLLVAPCVYLYLDFILFS